MPDEGDGQFGAAATQGKLAPQGKESFDGLQRDLEVEVVNHLRLQNAQLMEELDRLRALVSQKGSNSSWSELGGVSACAGIPPEGEHSGFRHEGYQTPRSAQQFEKGKREIRFTPNGTRIPDGCPRKKTTLFHVKGLNHLLSDQQYLHFLNRFFLMNAWRSLWMDMKGLK
jgi:hypothetical protein